MLYPEVYYKECLKLVESLFPSFNSIHSIEACVISLESPTVILEGKDGHEAFWRIACSRRHDGSKGKEWHLELFLWHPGHKIAKDSKSLWIGEEELLITLTDWMSMADDFTMKHGHENSMVFLTRHEKRRMRRN